ETVKLAIEKDPTNAVLYSVQGSLFDSKANPKEGSAPAETEMLKWYEEAERAYKKSIELDPKFFDAYFNVGVLYNNRAAFEYEKCNKIKVDSEYMTCKKGADEIYLKAVPYFEKAHELRPDDNQTIQQLMKLYAKTNDQDKYQAMKAKLAN
ncbi:MAG: tetratricopeptide repeat protein, partial [Bacteroidota bacterium]|nr:tetratricopeptide repeat protein [Bacteroidota bacterium]